MTHVAFNHAMLFHIDQQDRVIAETMPDMSVKKGLFGMTNDENYVYTVGGGYSHAKDKFTTLSDCTRFDIKQ